MFLDDVGGVDFSCKNLPNNKPITDFDLVWVADIITELPISTLLPIEFVRLVNSLYDDSLFTGE